MKRNISEEVQIESLQIKDVEKVQSFIDSNWRKDHPVSTNKDLFLWQYHGYGEAKGYSAFQVAKLKDEVVGFRGVIPLEIQLPQNKSTKEVVCYASAMWMIHQSYRGRGIGYKMHHNTEVLGGSSLAIGSNRNTSGPIYKRGGYYELTSLNRYILPLTEEHTKLYIEQPTSNFLKPILRTSTDSSAEVLDVNTLEKIWNTSSKHLFALNRTAEYWEWRYQSSPVFKYKIFGSETEGIVVVRIEQVIFKEGSKASNLKVLRIIEAIPPKSSFWSGHDDSKFSQLIQNACQWGINHGCCLADFFCSNPIFDEMMKNLSFYKQSEDFSPAQYSHASLFQPLELKEWLFNLYLRIDNGEVADSFDFKKSYFVRSDTDQDRPNLNL